MPLVHESPWTSMWMYDETCTCTRCIAHANRINQNNAWMRSYRMAVENPVFFTSTQSVPYPIDWSLDAEPDIAVASVTRPGIRRPITPEQRFQQAVERTRVSTARNRNASRPEYSERNSQHDHVRTACTHVRRNCTCGNPLAVLREPCYYCTQKQRASSISPEIQKKLSEIHVSEDYHSHECHMIGRHGTHSQYLVATECYCDNANREVQCIWHDPNQPTWNCSRIGCGTHNSLYALCCAMCSYRPPGYRVFRAETLTKLGEQVKTEE